MHNAIGCDKPATGRGKRSRRFVRDAEDGRAYLVNVSQGGRVPTDCREVKSKDLPEEFAGSVQNCV